MSENHKERSRTRTQTGYYVAAERVGNSLFLTRGDYRDGLYEVTDNQVINYQNGRKFNTCSHTVVSSDNGYLPASATEFTSIRWKGEAKPAGDITAMYPLDSVKIGLKPSGQTQIDISLSDIENARVDGYNRLIHLNPPRHMNTLQAVMELKDTKQTVNGFLDFVQWGHRMLGRKMRVGRGLLKPLTAATKLADFASAYLWYKFGVEPTARDIAQFREETLNGKLRVKGIKPQQFAKGQVVKAFYSAKPARSDVLAAMYPNCTSGNVSLQKEIVHTWTGWNTWSGDILPNGVVDPLSCRTVVVNGSIRGCFFAEVKNSFEIDGIDELKRRYQWNCPTFRTLWELLPFSFLVDWVIDVGKAIERLEKRYVQTNFASKLGPVWVWEKVATVTYKPKIEALAMSWDTPRTLGRTQWAYNHNVRGNLGYYQSASSVSFIRRRQVSAPGLVVPVLSRSVKAYQISTGMALLMQAAKGLIRGH